MILLESIFQSPILDMGDIIQLIAMLGALLAYIYTYGRKNKEYQLKIKENSEELDNIEKRLNGIREDYTSRIDFLDKHVNIEIQKNREDISDLRTIILKKLSDIELKLSTDVTYLRENVKYLTTIIGRHETKLDKLEDKINEHTKLDK